MSPRYEYECPKCKTTIELQQKLSEKIAPMCCEKDCNIEMNPIISSTSFSLKGHSWARDGYKNQKKQR